MSPETIKAVFCEVNNYTLQKDLGALKKDTTVVIVLDIIKGIVFISDAFDLSENAKVEKVESSRFAEYLKLKK